MSIVHHLIAPSFISFSSVFLNLQLAHTCCWLSFLRVRAGKLAAGLIFLVLGRELQSSQGSSVMLSFSKHLGAVKGGHVWGSDRTYLIKRSFIVTIIDHVPSCLILYERGWYVKYLTSCCSIWDSICRLIQHVSEGHISRVLGSLLQLCRTLLSLLEYAQQIVLYLVVICQLAACSLRFQVKSNWWHLENFANVVANLFQRRIHEILDALARDFLFLS